MKLRATGCSPQTIDRGEVRRALGVLADPAHGVELTGPPAWKAFVGKADDLDALVEVVQSLAGCERVYIRLNPVAWNATKSATDRAILERLWLLLDIDPEKPAESRDDPATDAEHERVRELAEEVRDHLAGEGWPAPVLIDSGNGWYLLYRLRLPNTDHVKILVKSFLKETSARFSDQRGHIDRAVYNASRLIKLPGTLARKGRCSDDRPYRMCRLVHVPAQLEEVTAEQIAAATGTEEAPQQANGMHPQPKRPGLILRAGTGRAAAYVRRALENERGRVLLGANGPDGVGRNYALNKAAYCLGGLVSGGYLTRSEAEAWLRDAARDSGLYDDPGCGEAGVNATIASGMEAGLAKPRVILDLQAPAAYTTPEPAATLAPGETLTVGADEVMPESIDWLWYARLPLGKLVTWAGVTSIGKSFLSCDLAARLSVGGEIPLGGGECFPKCGTLLLNCEDGYADTIVPRLIEAGADRRMVHFMKADKLASWTMAHLDTLEKAIRETPDCRLVFLDAASSFLGGVDDHKNSEFRQLLAPLVLRAQEWRVCIVLVTHFNKAGGHKVEVLDRVMGGVAWVSGVRLAAAFVKAPSPDDTERRLCVPLKSNICRRAPALAYRLANVDGDRDRCRVEWLEEIDTTAEEAMDNALASLRRPRDVIAADWLIERFRLKREWESESLFSAGRQEGVSRSAIFEAKAKLDLPRARRVVSEGGDATFIWWVPADWPHLDTGRRVGDEPPEVPF